METELLENAKDPTKLKQIVNTRRCCEIVDLIRKTLQQENLQSDISVLEALTCGITFKFINAWLH